MSSPQRPRGHLPGEPGTATWLAEQTVIGALLRSPQKIGLLASWLGADAFADPLHRGLFAAIDQRQNAGALHPVDAPVAMWDMRPDDRQRSVANMIEVQFALEAAADPAAPSVDVPALAEIAHAGTGVSDQQLRTFGQMVLEGSVRRQLDGWGVHLQHAVADVHATGRLDAAVLGKATDTVMNNLLELQTQMSGRNARHTTVPGTFPPVGPAPGMPPDQVAQAQRTVIGAVLTEPRWQHLLDRLQPEDFVGFPAHATTWQAMQEAALEGPLHPVTVAAASERLSYQAMAGGMDLAPGLPVAQLQMLAAAPPRGTGRAVVDVAGAALAAHAGRARDQMQAAAADPRRDATEAMDLAQVVVARFAERATRLTRTDRSGSLSARLDEPPIVPTPVSAPPGRSRGR
ncbi:DnaB-like helicase N-terminal domain-containing protein [Amycolatopsis tolypomycina]|uniref:DnaB-like helicase N-terminal domain-containing protein n=1 Tax=Amycolatopsis tolypomycina TaxID=208445 RepID=UPI0033AB05DC